MHSTTFLALWVIAALVFVKTVQRILTNRHHATLARDWGCQAVPAYSPGDPFGIYSLYLTLQAAWSHYLPEYMFDRVKGVSEQEGRLVTTFRNVTAGLENIFTCEPRNIQAILATQFKDFEFGEIRNRSFRPLLGNGIFASDGKQWEHARAMLRPQFAREQINDLELEERHFQNMMHVLPLSSDGSTWTDVFDIQPLFFRLTIDTATEFLFGESIDSQVRATSGHETDDTALQNTNEQIFSKAFDQVQAYTFRNGRLGKAYFLGQTPDYHLKVKQVHAFVDYYVQMALKFDARKEGLEDKTESGGRKERYVFLEALAQTTRDPIELRDHLLNILLAGRDTTASLLSWVLLLLAQHPDIFVKLRRVVLEEFGTYEDPQGITFARLKSCTYLQYTLNETLRLYAVVPVNQRTAAVNTTLPIGGGPEGKSPVFVPKGTEVYYSVHAMHKRADLWGGDATEFRPERWEGRKHGWEYLPFNGGPRICLGQQFALTEAGYVLVRLLQKVDAIEWRGLEAEAKAVYRMTLTTAPAYGVKIRLRMA